MKIFPWRKSKGSLKENKLPISGIATDCVSCTSPTALEKEPVIICTPAGHNSLNIHGAMQSHAALLKAERNRVEVLIEAQRKSFVR